MQSPSYFFGVVKILEKPQKKIFNDKIIILQIRALVPQLRKTNSSKIVLLTFWKSLTSDTKNYYQVNQYMLIEGYVLVNFKKSLTSIPSTSKKVIITVLKGAPFSLTK